MNFIWSTSLFTHMRINQVDSYLSEMSRVLKSGAKIWNSYFILDEVSEPLARSGALGRPRSRHSFLSREAYRVS